MIVSVLTPSGNVFEGEAVSLIVPALDGELGVFQDHAPLIAALGEGKLEIRQEDGVKTFTLSSGIVEVNQNVINIIAEKAVA